MEPKLELRVPTVAVPIRLAVRGQGGLAASDGELFVADLPRTGRAQLLDDVAAALDDSASFVPVRTAGSVRLYGKDALAWLAVPRGEDGELELYDRTHEVVIELVSGGSLAGLLFDSSPSDRPRVFDYLNRARRFVRLWTSDEQYLINKSEILHVRDRE